MNSWCESCARKSCCYTMEIRPRCYVATTNTASGTPESYLAKSLRYSRDGHEIAKDEPQTDYDKGLQLFADILFDKEKSEQFLKECKAMGIEPQTERSE